MEEAELVKVDFKQQQNEEDDFTRHPTCSSSMSNPFDSLPAWQIRWPMKRKRKPVPKKPLSLEFMAKLVFSHDRVKSGSSSYKKKRTRIEDLYDDDEAKFSVMERAEEVLTNVADEFPGFLKCMLPSNVTHGFWLIFPKKFCNLHLPRHDTSVILVDECGKEYETNYLAERHGLSGGWRGFSLAHRLLKGDILVFHLIRRCTLMVHIVRVHGLDEVDAALCLMTLVAHTKRTFPDKNHRTWKKSKKYVEPLLQDFPQKKVHENGPAVLFSKEDLVEDQSETISNGFGPDVSEGSEISYHQANEQRCHQNLILHGHLFEDINCRFRTGEVS